MPKSFLLERAYGFCDIEPKISNSNVFIQVAIIFLLILVNAFFAMSEIAIITLNDNKIKKMANEGHKQAKKIAGLLENSSNFLAIIQVGVTLSGFLTSASASAVFSEKLASLLSFLPFSQDVLSGISMIIVTIILSYFSLVLGELVPKKIAMRYSEKISFKAVGILKVVEILFSPFIKFLSFSTNFVLKLLGLDSSDMDETVTEEEILMMVDEGEEKGVFEGNTKDMIKNIFEFDDKKVSEIMTHRTDIFAVEDNNTINDAITVSLEQGCSRIPVFHEDIDDIIGVVYAKDLLRFTKENSLDVNVTKVMRKAFYIPESKLCSELFSEMISSKTQIAIIVDEYGGTEGLVTMEDLVESIVGDIQDEYDNEEEDIKRVGEGSFSVDGTIPLDEIEELLNINMPESDYDTLAGFMVDKLGKIPSSSEKNSVDFAGYNFSIEKVKDRRILKVLINKN